MRGLTAMYYQARSWSGENRTGRLDEHEGIHLGVTAVLRDTAPRTGQQLRHDFQEIYEDSNVATLHDLPRSTFAHRTQHQTPAIYAA